MKKLFSLIIAILMIFSVTACGNNSQDLSSSSMPSSVEISQVETPSSSMTETPQVSAEFPVTVTDHLGRKVTLESKPEKIVSGYYITSSLLIALGLEDKLVGVEAKAKTRPIYSLSAPNVLELPSVGTAKEFDLEGCVSLKPDLVILPVKLKDAATSLEQLGINVIAVNPEDNQLLRETIEMVGIATGTVDKSTALIRNTKVLRENLTDVLEGAEKPKVYLASNSALLRTAGAKMYQNSMVETAGGTNVAAEITDSYWADISYEQLLTWNPDVIVIVSDASYTVEDVLKDKNLVNVTAVKNKSVYKMPAGLEAWDSPVPSAILGSLWLGSVLHGDRYTAEHFVTDATAFYKEFYDFDVTADLLA